MSANCPKCGRFARSWAEHGYDGSWNQTWVHTECAKCGTAVRSIV